MEKALLTLLLLSLVSGARESFSQYLTDPDPFYFGDDYASHSDATKQCDTELEVMDNDGSEGFVAGGFTQSKDMVWADPVNNFSPPKVVPTVTPTGCYDATAFTCDD
jgi:hypothetical protein